MKKKNRKKELKPSPKPIRRESGHNLLAQISGTQMEISGYFDAHREDPRQDLAEMLRAFGIQHEGTETVWCG